MTFESIIHGSIDQNINLFILKNPDVSALVDKLTDPDLLTQLDNWFRSASLSAISTFAFMPFNVGKYASNVGLDIKSPSVPPIDSDIIKIGTYNTGISTKRIIGGKCVLHLADIKPVIKEFTDFPPYTNYNLYLPWYGQYNITRHDMLLTGFSVDYVVDIISTSATIVLSHNDVIYARITTGFGVSIPMTSVDVTKNLRNIVTGVVEAGLAVAGGVAAFKSLTKAAYKTTAKAISIAAVSASGHNFNNINYVENVTGQYTAMDWMFMPKNVMLFITKKKIQNPSNFNHNYGRMCMKTLKLKNLKGFTKINMAHLDGINATANEQSRIYEALIEGVIL